MKPVCKNIYNDQAYYFEGGNTFRNIRTGQAGEVDDEKAREIFRFNLALSEMMNEFPEVENLIKVLNLKFDNNLKNEK